MTELARNIQALRKRLGSIERELSYGGLARKLTERLGRKPAIAASTVLKWEKEERNPDPWVLVELAALAGVTVEEFIGKQPKSYTSGKAAKRGPSDMPPESFTPAPRSKPDDKRRRGSA